MKQGETKRKLPKDKHEKQSWKTRNEARKTKQEEHHRCLRCGNLQCDCVRTADYYYEEEGPCARIPEEK